MKFFNQGFAAMLAALSLTGAAHADFIKVGTATENRIQVDTRWTRDNVYILSRCIFVDNGATLTIEPGTIIRGVTVNLSGFGSEPGTLIVARGGKLVANGTADDPIIFTSIDDLNVPGGINTVPDTFTADGTAIPVVLENQRPATAATSDVITVSAAGKRPAIGDTVKFSGVVAGLTAGTVYTVATTPGATTFTLTGVDITAAGNVKISEINSVVLADSVTDNELISTFTIPNGATYIVSGTTVPGGLASATTYHVVNTQSLFAGRFRFQLSLTNGGAAEDITSNGSGVVLAPASSSFQITGDSRDPSLTANDYSADGAEGDNGFSKSAAWGGVVICGRAFVSQGTGTPAADLFSGGTFPQTTGSPDGLWDAHAITEPTGQNNGIGADYVEGLSTASGSTLLNPTLAIYGGTNDADNSGVMRFCSLRYTGFVVGAAATGNEINGLTICGAGAGSVFEHIDVFQSRDDGFEWFGGKHDTRFLASISNQDDSFDGDEGFRGIHQFWLAAQGTISQSTSPTHPKRSGFSNNDFIGQEETASDYLYDKLLEWDGGEGDNGDRLPITDIYILNATLLAGNTQKRGMDAKLEAHVNLHNAVYEGGTTFSHTLTTTTGTVQTLLSVSNIHSNYDLSSASSIGLNAGTSYFVDTAPTFAEETTSQIASAWNTSAELTGSGTETSDLYKFQGFDPRTASGSNARTANGTFATPIGFVDVDAAGAMFDNNWLSGWSTLEWLEVLPATNVARPVLTIGNNGTNPTISFPTASATVQYVIEKSTDGKNWTVLTTTPVTNATTVSHTDTTTPIASTVLYRAYAL
jgi:hypothetical protein